MVGVDPAAAMLDIAKAREGGAQVRWVQADARQLDLGERFDLIILTGHSFQVFLTNADQAAVLASIRRHLTPSGRFVFDSRNPALKAWESWTPACSRRCIEHPSLGDVNVWNDAQFDPATEVVHYQTFYQPNNQKQSYSAEAKIRFTPRPALEARLEAAGLHATRWLGSWEGTAYSEATKEIIPVGGLR